MIERSHIVLPFSKIEKGESMSEWTQPPYADPGSFDEHEITVGVGDRAVPGTVTIPPGGSSVGVVLLSGSGPFDRDETSGPNKPLKDLAWGLAGAGVAVLRFDKYTFARPEAMTRTSCGASSGGVQGASSSKKPSVISV